MKFNLTHLASICVAASLLTGCGSDKADPATATTGDNTETPALNIETVNNTPTNPLGTATTGPGDVTPAAQSNGVNNVPTVTAGSSTTQTQSSHAVAQKPKLPVKKLAFDATPDTVVWEFLNALKTGNDGMAESLLTNMAQTETKKRELAVLPPGAPKAQFEVAKPQYTPDGTGVWVDCLWTEMDANNKPETDRITWALRFEQQVGWRIAGMATELVADQPPLFLNFEQPDDMMAKLKEAAEYMAQQQQADAVRQAQQPSGGTNLK